MIEMDKELRKPRAERKLTESGREDEVCLKNSAEIYKDSRIHPLAEEQRVYNSCGWGKFMREIKSCRAKACTQR